MNRMRKRKILFVCMAGVLAGALCLTGCGKKKKISYGDTPGVASGTIDVSGDKAKLDIDNIIAPIGSDIDYTSGIETIGEDDDYSVEVNASNVNYDKPGTYTVGYTVKSGGESYTSNVKVTISDDESLKVETPSQNIISSSTGETVNVSSGGADNTEASGNAGGNADNTGASGNTGSNTSDSSGSAGSGSDSGQASQPETEKVLITNGNTPTYTAKEIENAVIELLSGDVVTIGCSTNKYITATRTDESVVEKNGHQYQVSKLVIVFNTGDERTLETIEKKID